MDNFEQNLAVLAQGSYHHIDPLREDDLNIAFVAAETDVEYYLRQPGEQVIAVRAEVDRDNMPDPLKEELIFILGFGTPQEMAAVINAANPQSTFVIVEPNLAFFQHALEAWDMRPFAQRKVIVMAKRPEGLGQAMSQLATTSVIVFCRNVRIYSTYYYRHHETAAALAIAKTIAERITYQMRHLGNDFTDGLWGISHDLANIRHLDGSVDVGKLKDRFRGRPAVVVSAGPSLEKNMHLLPRLKGKALIIAVDTILAKLMKNNIIPDVVCSIERIDEIYDYFYKGKDIPASMALVAPPVLKPIIFDEHQGERVIPFRGPLPVYKWLAEATGIKGEAYIEMGSSVAHLAFGFAAHTGCSPIILTGQDLAFGTIDGTLVSHSKDTIYEDVDKCSDDDYNCASAEIEGYYGGKVATSRWWLDVKLWLENQITEKGLDVVNATEGGAKIAGTRQSPLGAMVDEYAGLPPVDFAGEFRGMPKNNVALSEVIEKLRAKIAAIEEIARLARQREKKLKSLKITAKSSEKQLRVCWRELQKTDEVLKKLIEEPFYNQLIHSNLIHIAQKVYAIPQIINSENLATNRDLQVELCFVVGFASDEMRKVFDDSIAGLEKYLDKTIKKELCP